MVDESVEQCRYFEELRKNLPSGVKLVRVLRGHTGSIGHIAWSPDGKILASPSGDKTILLWDAETGDTLHKLEGHNGSVFCVDFDPVRSILASGSSDQTIRLWDPASGKLLHILKGHKGNIYAIAFDPFGRILASGSDDGTIGLWDQASGKLLWKLNSQIDEIISIAFDTTGCILASVGLSGRAILWEIDYEIIQYSRIRNIIDTTQNILPNIAFDYFSNNIAIGRGKIIEIRDASTGRLLKTLEGHLGISNCLAFSTQKRLLVSRGCSHKEILLWRTDSMTEIARIELGFSGYVHTLTGLSFHPKRSWIACADSDLGVLKADMLKNDTMEIIDNENSNHVIYIFELDLDILLGQSVAPPVTYTSAKVVLIGDAGVGKTGLGWRLSHGEFKEHSSTHGQQFWLLKQLCRQRSDGTQCEAVLWDLAGQDDYRLIHALFLDDADLALVLFDPTHNSDPLSGVEYWMKQLKVEAVPPSGTPTMLIAARMDRGTPRLTQEELEYFCKQRGIKAYLSTSAKSGEGIEELIIRMQNLLPWDSKPATITTETFKRIKDLVLGLKEDARLSEVILKPEELRQQLEKMDRSRIFSDAEMLTAVGHLATHGYVTMLKTSKGEPRILLAPELLNNLAASFILEARRNQRGLGSLEELRLLSGGYKFSELDMLAEDEKAVLIESAVVLFLEHNICFRETDPLNGRAFLVFPELINLKKPLIPEDTQIEERVAYTVTGAVENVYASLVVLLGYTQTFTRTNQWRDHARYEVGTGHVCGFRLETERAGELDFVLYFGTNTPAPVRTLFQSLFENFLARRNVTVRRYEPVVCPEGHTLNRAVVRQKMNGGVEFTFCNDCGLKIMLPRADQPIHLTKRQAEEVKANRRAADLRSRFEQALYRLKNFITDQKIDVPECFISYAWGNLEQERWIENRLATDLQKAGIVVVLDRWENGRIGASVPRFVERVGKADRVIVVGTSLYQKKYENNEPMRGFVVAAEGDLIGRRMIGSEDEKQSVLPVLLEGTVESAFPPLLQGRVYADFRNNEAYFEKALELLLSLYRIPPQHTIAIELRESLMDQKERRVFSLS